MQVRPAPPQPKQAEGPAAGSSSDLVALESSKPSKTERQSRSAFMPQRTPHHQQPEQPSSPFRLPWPSHECSTPTENFGGKAEKDELESRQCYWSMIRRGLRAGNRGGKSRNTNTTSTAASQHDAQHISPPCLSPATGITALSAAATQTPTTHLPSSGSRAVVRRGEGEGGSRTTATTE